MNLPAIVARLEQTVASLERRVENMFRHGPVSDVDTEKQRCRMIIGKGPDGKDQKSPWIPYAQQAGALKIHTPVSIGQNMTMLSPSGDLEQAVAMPMIWNNENESPSQSQDENVLTFGDVRIVVTESSASFSVGGHTVTISGAGTKFEGGAVGHDDKDIGKTHRHPGVMPGGSVTEVPTAGGP